MLWASIFVESCMTVWIITYHRILSIFTHRHSIAECGGCFQWCLSVCLFVCQCVCPHDNFRTTKRRTIKLGGYVHCTKISPEFECQGQRSKVMVTSNKKRKTAESSTLTMHSMTCTIGGTQQAATDDTIAWPFGGDRLCQWENQHMLSSYLHYNFSDYEFCAERERESLFATKYKKKHRKS